jgi:hypothetical protein
MHFARPIALAQEAIPLGVLEPFRVCRAIFLHGQVIEPVLELETEKCTAPIPIDHPISFDKESMVSPWL